ncbi:hypothetical protein AM228_08110 [Planktothricoides sp. SR001]|uniref:GldG family protein n=1 Tax=Planktothricoides sp. SR001 TaxID=1705388 RepID=UPI0006C52023|nr:Gldg family protein [Planktothricoides sp. SR001]KOR37169.1 hypothetical protein AM228_08110 [Planktothricoides sp. SR001]
MKGKTLAKYLKYTLLFAAPCLMIIGLSSGYVLLDWGPIPVGFIIAGIVCFLLWLIFQDKSGEGFWGKRSTEAGANAFISTIAILIILGLINFFGLRYSYQIDLTENRQFSLAPKTEQVVQNLPSQVKVLVFTQTPDAQTRELLGKYSRISNDKLLVEFVNPYEQPTLANKFEVRNVGDVYVASSDGELREFVQSVNQRTPLVEEQLTNGLLRLTGDRRKVYFLQGHGERSLDPRGGSISQAINSLQAQNIANAPINLIESKTVPEDATLLAIIGPKRALAPGEVQEIKAYLNRGGHLLLAIDPKTDPGLNSLLEEWGVILDQALAIDDTGNGQAFGLRQAAPLITNYGNHPITRDFGNGFSFYPLARPIQFKEIEGIEATPFLITNQPSWAESEPDNPNLSFDPQKDRPGPLYLGVALVRGDSQQRSASRNRTIATATPETATPETETETPAETETATPAETETETPAETETETPAETETETPAETATPETETETAETPAETETTETETETPAETETQPTNQQPNTTNQTLPEARMVVLGNSEFMINGLFELQLNGDVFLNSVNWLTGQQEELLSIRPQTITNRRIVMAPIERRFVELSLILLPIFGFGAAFSLWLQRR